MASKLFLFFSPPPPSWNQLRAVDTTTGEFGTAALSVQVIPGRKITTAPKVHNHNSKRRGFERILEIEGNKMQLEKKIPRISCRFVLLCEI